MPGSGKIYWGNVQDLLHGKEDAKTGELAAWNNFVKGSIEALAKSYQGVGGTADILAKWHESITIGYKYDKAFTPHVNGFYMIFMVHGTWYDSWQNYVKSGNEAGLSPLADSSKYSKNFSGTNITLGPESTYFSMMATDIDIPDLTQEYISVSSRIRNSFSPARNYFVSDFTISYVENKNLDIIRYHEGWHKYMNLLKRGEVISTGGANAAEVLKTTQSACEKGNSGYFLDMPFSNAVWVVVFKPFTSEPQMIIKLMGVLPVTLPLKQVVGNRSQTKMTVLNVSYKAADLFYKSYNNVGELLTDGGVLATSFKNEVLNKK
jgi:hypothetical protein